MIPVDTHASHASPRRRHIVAMSAGRATMMLRDDPIHEYILAVSGAAKPRVAFLPTASGDDPTYIVAFYEAYTAARCVPSHLSLFYRYVEDIQTFLLTQDVILVGGGNTSNMLRVWQLHGLDTILREAWESGIILCGGGAGAMCWFEGGITSSFGIGDPRPITEGLSLLAGSLCPHYDIEPRRRAIYHTAVADTRLPSGYAVEDDTALHFVDNDLREAVGSRAGARGFTVTRRNGGVTESPIPVRDIAAGRTVSPWYSPSR
jgi:dipeptidase E